MKLDTLVVAALAGFLLASRPVSAQPADEPSSQRAGDETIDLFGFNLSQTDRLRISGLLLAGWTHDGLQAQLGFEKQGRIGQATITFRGRATNRVHYLVSFNPVNEVSSKPACGEANFFFPNDPRIYSEGPVVPCDPENGHKRVDTYNTFGLDYINQQGPLREGYADWRIANRFGMRLGRFILPIGFAPPEVGSWTAKDLTRIQRLNAEANFGLLLAYAHRPVETDPGAGSNAAASAASSPEQPALFEAAAMAVLGDGNREKDYDWFYFANPTLDTNSALTVIGTLRARPVSFVDLRTSYKHGFTGSKVERLPSYWASKRRDDAFVVSAKVHPHGWVAVFGEYARYVWGPTESSAELLGVDPAAIVKPGYYVGGTFELPVTRRARAGITVTREEVRRDDSLIKYLAANRLYGVEMGKRDRGTIARVYLDVSRLVTVGLFWADISNPYPWVSGAWPVSGDRAFTGRAPDRYGLVVIARTP